MRGIKIPRHGAYLQQKGTIMEKPPKVYCPKCNKEVTYHYEKVNHLKYLIFTILSCGIWLPMWIASLFPSKICDECNEAIWED